MGDVHFALPLLLFHLRRPKRAMERRIVDVVTPVCPPSIPSHALRVVCPLLFGEPVEKDMADGETRPSFPSPTGRSFIVIAVVIQENPFDYTPLP